MSSINYIVSILKDAGFTKAQIKPATPSHINKLFADYLNSCEWSEEWFFSIDPSQLDGEQLKLYDSAKELYDTPDGEVLSPVEDMMLTLQLQLAGAEMDAECEADSDLKEFSYMFCTCLYNHVLKRYGHDSCYRDLFEGSTNTYLLKYCELTGMSDKWTPITWFMEGSTESSFIDEVNLVYDVNKLYEIGHNLDEVKQIILDYQDYDYSDSYERWFGWYPVHHDVKLDDVELPVEVIVVPQEVVSEPQEDIVSSTTTEDNVMNTSTFIPSWEVSGYVSLLDLDFGTYVPVVESEPVVEVVKPHYSDKWFGQCCDLNDNPEFTQWDIVRTGKPYFPEVVEFTPLPSKAPSIMNIGRGKVSFSKVLTPEQLAEAEASVARASAKMARRSAYASPVRCGVINNTTSTVATTTKSDKEESNARLAELTTMWERVVNPHAHSTTYVSTPLVDGLDKTYSRPIASATGRDYQYSTQVKEFKSTLFNVDEYDITRNVVVDVATTTPKSTPATPKAPSIKPSSAKFASNFNSLVIAKYTALNGGIIKDSLVLNKLTSALRANDMEAYNKYVTIFNNPQAVSLHRQAYDALITAS